MPDDQSEERAAIREALFQWSESLTRDDFEGDPRDLARSAFRAAWQARGAYDQETIERLAPVLAWIRENHVKRHDSDTLDVDHGPIVEWDYCDWCSDHGLPEDWPCMFVLALAASTSEERQG